MPVKLKEIFGILIKAVIIFALIILLTGSSSLLSNLTSLSTYNSLVPGRERLPYGENPSASYNLNTYNLNTIFSSHKLAAARNKSQEYRVFLIGDSSVWGTLQNPEETIANRLQATFLEKIGNKQVKVYNLGYPTHSTLKDLILLDYARRYQPDLVLWFVTLDSLAKSNQIQSPIVEANLQTASALMPEITLEDNSSNSEPVKQYWEKSLIGKRRQIAEWLKLQTYAFLWGATGIDQQYPRNFALAQRDLQEDRSYLDFSNPLSAENLAFDVIAKGYQLLNDTPLILVNEPILISSGEGSETRYNFNYPQWAYDQYRELLAEKAREKHWPILDLWDAVPESEFTNTAFHITPQGVDFILPELEETIGQFVQGQAPPLQASSKLNTEQVHLSAENKPQVTPTANTKPTSVKPTLKPSDTKATPTQAIPTLSRSSSAACTSVEYWKDMPVIPDYLSEQMTQIYLSGLKNGNKSNVLSIIGDCQSVPSVFLGPFDKPGRYQLGEFTGLQSLIDHFAGSWGARGIARRGGLNIAGILTPSMADPSICKPGERPLDCELRTQRPSIVLVSLEEWWGNRPASIYEGYLREVLETIIASGAVPLLTTKADNWEGSDSINQTIVKLACEFQVPLWNFYAAAQDLPNQGLWKDKFHLTVGSFDFSDPEALKSGRTVRNLTALQALETIWRELSRQVPAESNVEP